MKGFRNDARRPARWPSIALVAVLVAALAALIAGCGGGGSSSSGSTENSESTTATSQGGSEGSSGPACGAGTQKPASGKPILLGAIVTKQPGVDFSQESNGVEAYFECMNENGGVAGRPLKLVVEFEQSNPQEVAADATKLLKTEDVLGMVGSISLSDCAVNEATYKAEGIFVVGAGINAACYQQPNFASTVAGPIVDLETAARFMFKKYGTEGGFAVAQTQCPGCAAFNAGAVRIAEEEGIEDPKSILVPAPVTNPSALALQLAGEAGEGGTVALAFSGPELIKILNAAAQQGLYERANWACISLCSTPENAEALDSAWSEKLFGTGSYPLPGSSDEGTKLLEEVSEQYGHEKLGSLNEEGLVTALIAGEALAKLKPNEITRTGVNNALKSIHGFKTSLLCEPWSYSEQPIASEFAFGLENGEFVDAGGCVEAS